MSILTLSVIVRCAHEHPTKINIHLDISHYLQLSKHLGLLLF
jgi:hypothetical protein